MPEPGRIDRREFFRTAAVGAGAALFSVAPASALGRGGSIAPSERIVVGCIGMGSMGMGNLGAYLGQHDTRVVAVCDVDRNRCRDAKQNVDRHYGNSDCRAYHDFRELIARSDIDVVVLSTPDHWHGVPAVMAMNAGKDIYGEKPIGHFLTEGRVMADAERRNGRIWQTGSWQRSLGNFRFACELVRNDRLGKVVRIEVGLPAGGGIGPVEFKDPPPHLDYDFWVGPSRMLPYADQRTHWNWRWQLDYGGGQMMDWIGHHGDIAHWAMDWDATGPLEVEGTGEYPTQGIWDAATTYYFVCKYAGGVEMHVANGGNRGVRGGTRWIGANGSWIWVDRGGIDAEPKSLLRETIGPDETQLYRSPGHHREFLECVKSRRSTITPAEVAHRSASVGHLGQIAMLLGRKIRWNPVTEQVIGDPTAQRMLSRPMRSPWRL
ncbi:MAG TPA: Gfo/Idh/MocA family oxidoreductase [Chthonomonadales bacterium]|nr:Gfo/Idh/MocA family oxidoreductase [Chthonomonadales bacterium]